MESINVSKFESDPVQDKKLDSYGWKPEDFIANREITVTITIGEYRSLVSAKATADQTNSINREKIAKMEKDLKDAQAEAERLKAENYDLQGKLMDLRPGTTAEPDGDEGCPY